MKTIEKQIECLIKGIYAKIPQEQHECLSTFRTVVGDLYECGGIEFLGRAVNGYDENKPLTMKRLVEEAGTSALRRVIRKVSEYYYGEEGYRHVIWGNVARVADCESGNPSQTLWATQYPEICEIFRIEMEMYQPRVIIAMVGNTFCESEWDGPIWDGYLNQKCIEGVKHNVYNVRKKSNGVVGVCTATYFKVEDQIIIIMDRPEGTATAKYLNAIVEIIDELGGL